MDAVERHLENWSAWHRHSSNKLGYPTRALVAMGGGQSVSGVFEDFCNEADRHSAEVMEALVNDLPIDQRCAVYHKWLNCVTRARDQAESLAAAYDALLIKMGRRGLV